MLSNVFYLHHISPIGGVETFLYQIALKYAKTHDITIVYKTGDPKQLERYIGLVRCIRWDGNERFKCENLFVGYDASIAHFTEYKNLYFILHADYQKQNLRLPAGLPGDAKFLCVSDAIRQRNESWLGISSRTAYNPLTIDDDRKALRLISATRLTPEKGRYRMELFAKALREANVPFIWTVFSDDLSPFQDPDVVVLPTRLDILPYIRSADYLVQLSDTEAYSYAIIEALTVGTPVICTPLPMIRDINLKDGVNGFVLPFDMSEIPAEKIAKGLKSFTYQPNEDIYCEILAKGSPGYTLDRSRTVTVRHLINYFDIELQKNVVHGETHATNLARALMLEAKNFVRIEESR